MKFERFRLWLAGKILGHIIIKNEEKWKQVHIIEQSIKHRTSGTAFIYLFESNLGNRRFEIKTTLNLDDTDLAAWANTWPVMLKEITPWLNGRFVPGIPGFNEVDSIDVMAKLSMK